MHFFKRHDLRTQKELLKHSVAKSKSELHLLLKDRYARNRKIEPLGFQSKINSSLDENNESKAPEISVIVPVFNTSKYLARCLDHLKQQTLSNIEIICVDDGSSDDSLKILEDYSSCDRRFVVVSQEHQGVAAARNTAIEHASASYIMNCDSDDYFDPDMCLFMLETIKEYDVDVVLCSMEITYDVKKELQENAKENFGLKYIGKIAVDQEMMLTNDVSLCNKIYKRNIVTQNKISFPIGLHFEDAYFNDIYLSRSKYAYFLHLPLYNYIRHESSIMSATYKNKDIGFDHLLIIYKTWEYLENSGLQNEYRSFFWKRFFRYLILSLKNTKESDHIRVKESARAFVREHYDSFKGVSHKTQYSIKILLVGNFSFMHAMLRLTKWLSSKILSSHELRHEITELTNLDTQLKKQIRQLTA